MKFTFEQVVVQALQCGGFDVSILELIEASGLKCEDELGSALAVGVRLGQFGLHLSPDLTVGGLSTRRVLRPALADPVVNIADLLHRRDESSTLELKSSMLLDVRREVATGAAHRSDSVVHSLLKTVCAFANASGGVVLVGIADDKSVFGLSGDYRCGIDSRDKWQLELSNLVKGRVQEGVRLDPYIDVSFHEIDGEDVAHVEVVARRELTFLRSEDGRRWEYYCRSGNKTEQIGIDAFEEHILRKRGYLL